MEWASPTIVGNTISRNSAYMSAGGLYLLESDPIIANNNITDNITGDGDGGALFVDDSSPTIANNSITGNPLVASNACLRRTL